MLPAISSAGASKNRFFSGLAGIYAKYETALKDLYAEYKKAATKPEKSAIREKRKALVGEYASVVETFNAATPLVGKDLPFKAVGKLPFTVKQAKIASVTGDEVKFTITVVMDQDITDKAGEIKQRESVHFCAVDKRGDVIAKTWNYATNHGWIKLTKGTVYETRGH